MSRLALILTTERKVVTATLSGKLEPGQFSPPRSDPLGRGKRCLSPRISGIFTAHIANTAALQAGGNDDILTTEGLTK